MSAKSTLRPRALKAPRQIHSQRRTFCKSSQWQAPVTDAAEAETQSARTYCTNLVSTYDRPSYILSAFIPRQAQTFYLALRALNVSLSMIPDTTSSHTIGLMRLQFWRDTITKTLAGSPPKEPVAILLANAIDDLSRRTDGRARLSKGWFLRMINAREQTLTNTPFSDLAALESYAENTYSTLLYLTLSSLPLTSVTVDHVASHIGKAAGISAVLRGLPLVAFPGPAKHHTNQSSLLNSGGSENRQGAITLPLDIMSQSGVIEEEVFRKGAEAAGLKDAVFAVATRASDHLITARQMLKNLREGQDVGHEFEYEGEEGHEYTSASSVTTAAEKEGLSPYEKQLAEVERGFGVLMPAVSTQLWLDKLQSYDFDIFNPKLLRGDWTMPWRAYYAHSRKSF